ncbi:hypothetical protein A5707_21555 [Mycobacterium kyorinense]|uniref:DUF4226 domain-containing protein n=1 Tax=Mycobacterium kyorinense TaxID=487514 RepID=A0A1A2ZA94_9MYCO|nr:DUF4226 domain-containing protein [Mycobacterium kyorinense]OBI46412.1 hypothetical protein A5707_21555 [Mycobacterium kyorinense]
MEGLQQPNLGEAADAIRDAESFLAHQNSTAAQLDLQVVSAIMNAHLKTVEGRAGLDNLQQEIQTAVRTRTDLDTPSGARDFQRFLAGKLRDIRAVVANANLDDTSKSALMAAWTSLYDASRASTDEPSDGRSARAPAAVPPDSAETADADIDPLLDSLFADDPGVASSAEPAPAPWPSTPMPPAMPTIPGLGGGAMPGWGMPGGLPLPGPHDAGTERSPQPPDDTPDDDLMSNEDHGPDEEPRDAPADEPEETPKPEPAPAPGPTTITLPTGETVTAASPQLAAAVKAAAGGTPIPDAFRQQGITIPPPGTAVVEPVDATQLAPGDIGMFTNRHALALGNSKALLNGQIQHISTVNGPSFLGWQHPPAPLPATAAPTTETPVPTRPAAT